MIAVSIDARALLSELEMLPPSQRLPHLLSLEAPEALLIALCEETDSLAASEVGQGLIASELILALANDFGAPRACAEALGARAMALAYAGRLEESLTACETALDIAQNAGLVVEAARARLASVHPLARLARYDEAIAAGNQARDALFAAGELALAARADVSLGAVHDMREAPAEALRHYDRALLGIGGDATVVAQIETNRGIALMGLDEFARAEEAFLTAVSAFESSGLDWAAAVAEGNLAYLATRQGRLEKALHHFERARRCLEADEAPADLARLLAEQADALASLGMPAEALDVYARALLLLEHHGFVLEAANARAGLGRAQLRLGRLRQAGDSLTAAAHQLESLGQHVARARVDVQRAELALALDRPGEARVLAEDALEILSDLPSDAAIVRELLARLDLAAGDVAAAEAHIARALPIAERLDLAPLRALLLHLRGLAARNRGHDAASLADLRGAVEQIERIRGTLQAERFRTAFLGNHIAVYEDAVLAALAGGEALLEEVFVMVERAKGRALLDLIGGALDLPEVASASSSDPAEALLLVELGRIQHELNWHSSRIDDSPLAGETGAQQTARQVALHRLENEFESLQDRMAITRGLAGLYTSPLKLAEALRDLPAGSALIEYFAAGDELIALLLHDGQMEVIRNLVTLEDLEERVRRVHFQIGRAIAGANQDSRSPRAGRMLADARRELGGLYDLLIAPLVGRLADATSLVVVPHGVLHTLPFHALWDGQHYLIESYEVVTAPSASVYARLASMHGAGPGEGDAFVAGVPDALAPWIEAEANAVAALLGVPVLLGAEVTVEEFSRRSATKAIVHLACHGRFLPDRPLASGLKLVDRWLTVRDIYALRLDASLVTLSGCHTGRATVSRGDELLGLLRGFFAAGARSLLISLWLVNDESTTELMTDFYRNYQHGSSAATALRVAQRSLLARQPHPAYWAPFMLGGYS